MNIVEATASYETWLGRHLNLICDDVAQKHRNMTEEVFPFFRATFYRWAQTWGELCPDELSALPVLAVGDLHVENFGTWRDREGRLVWGVNDFDEASRMPYTSDLVRLCASAKIAGIRTASAAGAILEGYSAALAEAGRPLVLAESNLDLRTMATERLKDPGKYWKKLDKLQTWNVKVPKVALRGLQRQMPERGLAYRIVHRIAGIGSLGRERYVALAGYRGGFVAREAKALAPSACTWAQAANGGKRAVGDRKTPQSTIYQRLLDNGKRCHDPFVRVRGPWIIRRLAPDCSRIELGELPKGGAKERLLFYMGFETANVHLASVAAKQLSADLAKRKTGWLGRAADVMVKATRQDWNEWRAGRAGTV